MWFIFLIACIVVALAALLVILIGSVVVRYIVRKDREMERKFFEMDKEEQRMKKSILAVLVVILANFRRNYDGNVTCSGRTG